MDADGGHVTNLTRPISYDGDPSWSPDGKRICFTSNRSGSGFRLYVMDADGKNGRGDHDRGEPDRDRLPGLVAGRKADRLRPPGGRRAGAVRRCDPDGKNNKQLTNEGGQNSYATLGARTASGSRSPTSTGRRTR